MKARRDAGTAAPNWVPPQFVECKKCGRRATRQVWVKSQYVCPNCGHEAHIFGEGGVRREAEALGLPFLGALPLSLETRIAGDGKVILPEGIQLLKMGA